MRVNGETRCFLSSEHVLSMVPDDLHPVEPCKWAGAPHFVYEESEVQKDQVTCPKSHSQKLAHGIQTSGPSDCEAHILE